MSAFAFCVLGLTLPSLVSQYYDRLGLAAPPLTPQFVSKHLVLRVAATPTLDDVRLVSPVHTLVSHMFHHRDAAHWFANMYALVAVTAQTGDASFGGDALTFVCGGVAGVAAQTVATAARRRPPRPGRALADQLVAAAEDSLNWALAAVAGDAAAPVSLRLPLFGADTCVMMGASAGVYALMGAECVRIAVDLAAELRKLARLQRRQYLDSAALKERARIHNNIVHILAVAIGHVVAIGSQVVAAAGLFGDNNAYSIRQAPGGTSNASGSMPQVQLIDESVGYAAHVGGFLFGVTVRFFRVSLF